MIHLTDYPLLIFALSFLVMWASRWIGGFFLSSQRSQKQLAHEDFSLILTAMLTLLSLIIGFSFFMAVNRYDLRKNYEEAEANAIGTEYVRIDLLPTADAEKLRVLLRDYLGQRVLFYSTHDKQQIQLINARTAQLQTELWAAVRTPAATQPTSYVYGLVVAGMNDVLNSQGYTQAAWWNRIPTAAWIMMVAIALCCDLLFGYSVQTPEGDRVLFLLLPLVISIAFFLIAEIDSPNSGFIQVTAQNLISLADSLRAP